MLTILCSTLFKVVITKNPKTEICEFQSISITQYIVLWSSYSHEDKPLHEPCTSMVQNVPRCCPSLVGWDSDLNFLDSDLVGVR